MKQYLLQRLLASFLFLAVCAISWADYMSIDSLPSSIGINSYGVQNVAYESTWLSWTWNSVSFKGVKVCKATAANGGGIQMQGNASDASKQGFIFNNSAWPTDINKITIVLKVKVAQTMYDPAYTLYVGQEAHPTTTAITPASQSEEADGFKVYTQVFNLSNVSAKYFTIANNQAGALYIDKIYIDEESGTGEDPTGIQIDGIYYNINMDGTSVTVVNNGFYNSYSGSIVIPSSVTYNDNQYCVTNIGSSAFGNCSGLTSVTIPNSVTSIGQSAFSGCSGLTSVTLNANDIVSKTYSSSSNLGTIFGSQVKEYVLGDVVEYIGYYAFYGCSSLTSVTIPNSVTSIRDRAFYNCSGLTSVTIPNSVTSIGNYAFSGCSGLTSVTIPNSVTSIRDGAFSGCSGLTSVTIPNSVTSIGDYAFSNCGGLTSVTIPNSVTSIGGYAFYGCSGLTSIIIPDEVTTISSSSFPNSTKKYVNSGSLALLSLWKSGIIPYELTTDVSLEKPTIEYSSTQTTVTVSVSPIYDGYDYCVGDMYYVKSEEDKVTFDGLVPGGSKTIQLQISLGELSYSTTCYATTQDMGQQVLPVSRSASSFKVKASYTKGDAEVVGESLTVNGITQDGNTAIFTGLRPQRTYYVKYNVTVKHGDVTYTCSQEFDISTEALTLTTSQPKVISVGNAVVGAISNLDDAEENVGFEWRRTDWTEEFASNTGPGYLYNGMMEGYVRNLYIERLWKYRAYYETESGIRYYSEWVGIDPTNTNYYEPNVHTYSTFNVTTDGVEVKGYAMRGSDDITKQGFMYWENSQASTNARGNRVASVPSNAKVVEVKGNIMKTNLQDLEHDTEYCCVAFITTSENETFYGELQTFRTETDETYIVGDANGNGEVEIGDVTSVLTLMATPEAIGYDKKAADANGNGEIEIGDVTTILTIMANGGYPEEWNLTVRDQDNNYVVPAEGGTKTVVLTTTRDVELSCSESWAHLGTMSYNVLENGKIYELYPEITFDANTTGEVRAATIYFDNGTDNRLSLIYTQERVRYDVVPPTWKGFDYKVKKGGVGQETERGEICPGDKVRVYCYRKSNGVLTGMVKGTITLKWTTQASGPSVVKEMTENVITPVNPTYDGWLLYSYADFDIPEGGPYDFRKAEVTCNLNFECFGNAVRWEDHTSHMDPYIGSIYTTNCNATKGSACTTENVLLWKSN